MVIVSRSVFAFMLVSLFFTACDTRQQIDREAVKKEMKSREIRRLTDSEVQLEANRIGAIVSTSTGDELDSLMKTYNLIADTYRWEDAIQDSTINSIVDVFKFANANDQDVSKGVQVSTSKLFYYCIPLEDSIGKQGVTVLTIPKKELILNFPEK